MKVSPAIGLVLLVVSGWFPPTVYAQDLPASPPPAPVLGEPTPLAPPPVVVRGTRPRDETLEARPTHVTQREEMAERQVRSAPDALRYTPGVYVQQTAHSQASAYIRGRTGRDTLLLFDGLPLNNALFRQGPNQYLFTVDAGSIDHLEVVRGSASVELGQSALSGAILVHPEEPRIDPTHEGLRLKTRLKASHATADEEYAARARFDVQLGPQDGLLLGVGGRTVGQLESGGAIHGLDRSPGVPEFEKLVPRMEADGRTQMGTGFDELTADARYVHRLGDGERLVLAGYLYRQFDAPRTDQCPPPEAPEAWCLVYEEQFRSHAYAKAELKPERALLKKLDLSSGYQRQHERRQNDRVQFINGGRDDIDVWALNARAETSRLALWDSGFLRVLYGLDGTIEQVSSAGWDTLVGLDITRARSRGQYLDGSDYLQAGAFVSPRLDLGDRLTVRTGARVGVAAAKAPGDVASDTVAVDESWLAVVGNAGLEFRPKPYLFAALNVEQGFRPPNLDDLTGRQVTGQGIQIENPDLEPERGLTAEVGLGVRRSRLVAEVWAFQTTLTKTMERRDAKCPPSDRACQSSRAALPYQLVNLSGEGVVRGGELSIKAFPGHGLKAAGTLSYAWGEAPSPLSYEDKDRPLSRIPPLNGTVELGWLHQETGLSVGGALRFAKDQDRLSFGDTLDRRIPFGGTPGYAVGDLRAGLSLPGLLSLHLVLENITDEAYRVHGSSVNGAGRGLALSVEVQP